MSKVQELLLELKGYKWIDLTHELTNDSPYWQGMPEGVVNLNNTIIDYTDMNLNIQTQTFPGQFGTHIDYPAHFIQGGRLNKDFNIEDTVLEAVVVDISDKVKENNDYEVTIDDILEHEEKYGKIKENSFVILKTDWGKRWPDLASLENKDDAGQAHTPGWVIPTLEFLIDNRKIAGVGHETLDTDSAVSCSKHGDLVAERYLLSRDKFQVEVLNNVDKLPNVGSVVFVSALNIPNSNGLPVRVWAIVPEQK